MIYKNISCKYVISKIFRDLKPQDDNWIDDAIEWIAEAMEHIGSYSQLEYKAKSLTISQYRAYLPCDLYQIYGVCHEGRAMRYGTQTFDYNTHCDDCISTTSSNTNVFMNNVLFYANPNDPDSTEEPLIQAGQTIAFGESTYTISNNWIKTNFEEGTIQLYYKGFPVDEEGFPMIPDYVEFKEAAYWYVRLKIAESGNQDPAGYSPMDIRRLLWEEKCTQARNKAEMPSVDQMESFKNQWVRMIPNINAHSTFFESLGRQEQWDREAW